ncbi:ATP synthase subunit s, mitochondrial [Aphelenchoides besseyi]|nr:ATP synthase subunit s, mitochondrial [Aphelenchoides besseyi]
MIDLKIVFGLLKAKLAKYRQQLLEPTGKAGAKGEGFDVMKSGDARVAMVGFPSVGKSTFLSTVTKTESVAASYEFTTLTCIPGVIEYQGANIQLLDLPGIIEGAAQGKGRGRQVIAVAKTSDLILMMLDATKGDKQRELLERELEEVGIRLNRRRPGIYFKRKPTGGVKFTRTAILTHCNEKMVCKKEGFLICVSRSCRWQDLDKQSKAEKEEKYQLQNAFRLSDDMYISPEKPSDVLPQKAYEDQTRRDYGSMPIELHIDHTTLRYVDHSFDNKRRVKRYEHFQVLQYDQRFVAERLLFLGADLAAAHFLVHRGASVKFVGDSCWYARKNGDLPGRKVDGMYIEAIDASGTELMFEGFDNLYDLHHLRMLRLADCKYIDDWSLSRIGGVCSTLELLDLSGCNRISGKGLLALRTLRNLKSLRLERMNNQTDLGKSALLLEEALPNLQVVGLDYNAALERLESEKQLLSDDRTLIDAKGNVFVEDDNGALYYVSGKINERATVNEEDQPIMTSTIRRDLPEMDEIEFERLDRLSKGRLRHLLVGSPSGYMWSDQVETILAHEAKLDKKDGRLTDSKMLPLAERLERLNQLGVDPNTLINANSNEQISDGEKNSKQAAGKQ